MRILTPDTSTWTFFCFLVDLALAGYFVGCSFGASETWWVQVLDTGLALSCLFSAAQQLRGALILLAKEIDAERCVRGR